MRVFAASRVFGINLHKLVRAQSRRAQSFGTFFLRNRPELELMCGLLPKEPNAKLQMTVLACSKGAEVYSMMWAIRSARPDLRIALSAVDISSDIVEFAKAGMYARRMSESSIPASAQGENARHSVVWNTNRDQVAPMFERITDVEFGQIFETQGEQAKIRPWLRDGITWLCGDAADPGLIERLGPQDIVVANRFLCHMQPLDADACLRNLARLVKPGGYLFVSGVDLEVRTAVAKELGWKPVTQLIREVHEGDFSLRRGWPLEYWGLEPFCDSRPDWQVRYASVFQVRDPIAEAELAAEVQHVGGF